MVNLDGNTWALSHAAVLGTVSRSGTNGVGEAVFAGGQFNEGMDVFRAPAATAGVFQSELGFDLAWHHDAFACCIADIRIGDSLAQAEIHIDCPRQERL